MGDIETNNACITSTMLGIEDHGIMTFSLTCEWDGCGQGFGGYALDQYSEKTDKRIGQPKSIIAIRKILEVVGVDRWEDLEGKYVRVRRDSKHDRLDAIGHIAKNQWFNIREFFAAEKGDNI